MIKKERHPFAKTPHRARPLPADRTPRRERPADEASELTIELLEERLAPGRGGCKTAGWGC